MEICTIKLLVIVLTCLALKSNAEKVQAQRKIASILGEDDHDDKKMLNVERQNNHMNVRWDNKGDYPLSVECNIKNGEALYRVRSIFIGWKRDRRWKWDCRKVANKPMSDCSWTPHINNWGGPIDKKCPANFVLTGIKSVHQNAREDRRWKLKCCQAPGYTTTDCKKTKKLNTYGSWLEHKTFKEGAIVGLHSLRHINNKDREWQMFECKYTAKQEPSKPPVKTRHFFYVPYDILANLSPWGWGN